MNLTTTPYLIVAGDFRTTGGMDAANYYLAQTVCQHHPTMLVAHSVAAALSTSENLQIKLAARPLNKHLLGELFLSRAGKSYARQVRAAGGTVLLNGGNCITAGWNWAHYVHAVYSPTTSAGRLRSIKAAWHRRRSCHAEAKAFKLAHGIICNSQHTAREIHTHYQIPHAKLHVVYYGSDADEPVPTSRTAARAELGWDDRPRVLFIGSLNDHRKGFDRLYAAWQHLNTPNRGDAILTVIGTGAEREDWQHRVEHDGLSGTIEFLGFRADVPKFQRAADLLVHPSRYEAYGLGVHEAVSRGVPVLVASDAGVMERLSEVSSAFAITPDAPPETIANQIRDILANRITLLETAATAATTFRNHTWSDMAHQILALTTTP